MQRDTYRRLRRGARGPVIRWRVAADRSPPGARRAASALEVGDDAVGERGERRDRLLERERTVGQQRVEARARGRVDRARERDRRAAGAARRERVERPDRLESALAAGGAVVVALGPLPGEQRGGE